MKDFKSVGKTVGGNEGDKMLKIEYVKKEDLKPYVNNAKIHTGEQVEQIKKSIEEFGFNDPIAVWHDNEIIEGHGRLLAVMEMPDIKKVPIIRLDDLTEEQRKAYTLVHNKLTMNTDFDAFMLDIELEDLPDFDFEFYGFEKDGFDDGFIDDLSNEAVATKNNNPLDTFEVSLAFPKGKESEIKEWIKTNGREKMVEIIIKEVENLA